jgi:hypothetical protein
MALHVVWYEVLEKKEKEEEEEEEGEDWYSPTVPNAESDDVRARASRPHLSAGTPRISTVDPLKDVCDIAAS